MDQEQNVCCNPLNLEDMIHNINVYAITDELRGLFWQFLYRKDYTCLLCRFKLLHELWKTQPGRNDAPVMAILNEAEITKKAIDNDIAKIKEMEVAASSWEPPCPITLAAENVIEARRKRLYQPFSAEFLEKINHKVKRLRGNKTLI